MMPTSEETPSHIALNAHLLSGEASYRSAGIHGYLYNTLAHLPDAAPDMRFTILTGSGHPPEHPALTVHRTQFPITHPITRILWEQIAAPFILRRLHPDLLHGMAFALPFAWRGPAVVTIFDLSFLRYPGRLSAFRQLYLGLSVRSAARRARRVIAISQNGRDEISALLDVPEDRIDVAYPGVSPDFYPRSPAEIATFRARAGLPDRYILHLGTLEPRKNLPVLIRAYAQLPQRGAVKLVLAGGRGWRTEPLLALIEELGLEDDVILPGFIPGSSLPMWYNAAQLLAYPSVYEGFGMPLIEALACGVPVIASDTTSLPEAVGPGGVLLPPDDVPAWTDALSHLLDDPAQRAELSARGRQHARTFEWTQTARQTAESYRRALGLED
jgi:glycosyltransferase involved in cell wall biosynthesis